MDRSTFENLVLGTQEALRRFLTALCCGDASLADDIAQESYISAYLMLDDLRDPSRFAAWLHRIAYNNYISHRRSARPSAALDGAADMIAPGKADDAFRYEPLYSALAQLSDKERNAILLHYLEGYSVRETADITGYSADAVKQQLSRGRYHLKHLLS